MIKQKTAFVVFTKLLPKKYFKNNTYTAFVFTSKIEFKKYLTIKYKPFYKLVLKNVIETFVVPGYYNNGKVSCFETKDFFKKQIIYECKNKITQTVMMEWEKQYMERCVDFLNPSGHVLEFGFGLGYSADQFLKHDIKSYTVIENDINIYKKALLWSKKNKSHIINVVLNDWRDFVPKQTYDTFFFDTFEKNYSNELLSNLVLKCCSENSVYGGYNVDKSPPDKLIFHNTFELKTVDLFNCFIPTNARYVSKNSKLWLVKYINKNFNNCYLYE